MDNWKVLFEKALAKKLLEAANEFSSKQLKVIDIGIFPWHSSIELSLLFTDDDCDADDIDDIAAWPNYNYSEMNEGKWSQAKLVAKELNKYWKIDQDITTILEGVAMAARSEKINAVINKFNKAPDFKIQVLDPDNSESPNYCVLDA